LKTVYHGVATKIKVNEKRTRTKNDLFQELPAEIEAGRYHSWIVNKNDFPQELEITAEDENGYIMALRHKKFDVQGVQFHPESVLTPDGEKIMSNWLNI
jgi:anthranilate synthase component 2